MLLKPHYNDDYVYQILPELAAKQNLGPLHCFQVLVVTGTWKILSRL